MKFRDRVARFMQGRYGNDELTRFLMAIILIVLVVGMFVRGPVCQMIAILLLVLTYARIFSKNYPKRYGENQIYLKYRNGLKFRWDNLRKYHIYHCPSCKQKIRIPRGKGKIAVRCPKCNTEFIRRS